MFNFGSVSYLYLAGCSPTHQVDHPFEVNWVGQIIATKLPPVGHPKMVVKSKGNPPKISEQCRFRNYFK